MTKGIDATIHFFVTRTGKLLEERASDNSAK